MGLFAGIFGHRRGPTPPSTPGAHGRPARDLVGRTVDCVERALDGARDEAEAAAEARARVDSDTLRRHVLEIGPFIFGVDRLGEEPDGPSMMGGLSRFKPTIHLRSP
jgi:hypothetical protein